MTGKYVWKMGRDKTSTGQQIDLKLQTMCFFLHGWCNFDHVVHLWRRCHCRWRIGPPEGRIDMLLSSRSQGSCRGRNSTRRPNSKQRGKAQNILFVCVKRRDTNPFSPDGTDDVCRASQMNTGWTEEQTPEMAVLGFEDHT